MSMNAFESEGRNCLFIGNAQIWNFVMLVVVYFLIIPWPWDSSGWVWGDFANKFCLVGQSLSGLWSLRRHDGAKADFKKHALWNRFPDAVWCFADVPAPIFLFHLENCEIGTTRNDSKISYLIERNLGVRIYLYELPFENKSSCPSRDHVISGVGKPSALQNRVAAWPSATRTFCNSVISKICGALVTCRSTSFSITLPRSRLIFKYYFVSKIISKSNAMFLPGTYIFQNPKRSGYESVEIIIIWLNGN